MSFVATINLDLYRGHNPRSHPNAESILRRLLRSRLRKLHCLQRRNCPEGEACLVGPFSHFCPPICSSTSRKVRSAPKLPPREIPAPTRPLARPAPREKLTASRQPHVKSSDQQKTSVTDSASQTEDTPKRKPPKLGPRKTSSQA
jgi:hypothetical protein